MVSGWCIAPCAGSAGLRRRRGPRCRPGPCRGGACRGTPPSHIAEAIPDPAPRGARPGCRARPPPPRRQVAPTPAARTSLPRKLFPELLPPLKLPAAAARAGEGVVPAGHARLAARAARGSANGAMARSLDGIDLAALRVRTAAGEPCPGLGAAVPAPRSSLRGVCEPQPRYPLPERLRVPSLAERLQGPRHIRGGDSGDGGAVLPCPRRHRDARGARGAAPGLSRCRYPGRSGVPRSCPARSAAPRSLPSVPGWQIIPTDIAKDVASAAKRKQMGNEELLDAWRFGFCGLFVVIEV